MSKQIRSSNEWVDTQARVIESRVRGLGMLGGPSSDDSKTKPIYSDALVRITWTDELGVTHSGEFEAPEESPLYQLIEGDTFPIRYKSSAPDEFCVRGLAQDQAASAAKKIAFAIVVGAVVILVWFGPDLLIAFSKK